MSAAFALAALAASRYGMQSNIGTMMVSRFHLFICSRFVHICVKLARTLQWETDCPTQSPNFLLLTKFTAVYCPNHVADVRYPLQPRSMVTSTSEKNRCSQMKTKQNPAGLREFSKIFFLFSSPAFYLEAALKDQRIRGLKGQKDKKNQEVLDDQEDYEDRQDQQEQSKSIENMFLIPCCSHAGVMHLPVSKPLFF